MGWTLQAVEGASPVRVGGQAVASSEIQSGDVITLGEVRLRFENKDPNLKSTVVVGDWQPPSAVRRRIETPPSAFEAQSSEAVGEELGPPPGEPRGRPTHRPQRIIPGPKSVGGFDAVSSGLHSPAGLGAAPPVESDFNREAGQRQGEKLREPVGSAAERARAERKSKAQSYAGWVVAAILALAIVALLLRG
jgi:hypothetical protein